MSRQRPTLLVFLVFATSLGALAVAGVSAWWRCGRGSDCSPELALAIVAVAPASLIAILMVLLLRTKMKERWLRSLLLAGGVGVATLPLAAFLLGDVRVLPAFAVLVVVTALLVLRGERGEGEAAPARPPPAPIAEAGLPPATHVRPSGAGPQPTARPSAGAVLAVLDELAALNNGIIRHCELLTSLGSAPASPRRRRSPGR